jgi:hypothetical protein
VEDKIKLGDRLSYWPHELRYQRSKRTEKLLLGIGRHLPRKVRYWTWLSVTADATTSQQLRRMNVPGIPLDDLLRVTGDQLMKRRSRDKLEAIATAAQMLWDNRLGWSEGRAPYAPRAFWGDLAEALGEDAELVAEMRAEPRLGGSCTRPPAGWYCTRDEGHEGPCPALPVDVADRPRSFPYEEGDVVVLGPELFGLPDGSVLCYRGVNYVPQTEGERVLGDTPEDAARG